MKSKAYNDLIKFLEMNKDRFIPAKRLAFWINTTERELRSLVVEAIDKGHLIASTNEGYLLTDDFSRIEPGIRRLESHSISQWRRCQKLRKNAGTGQLELFKEAG